MSISFLNITKRLVLLALFQPLTYCASAQEITANTPWVWMGGDTTLTQLGAYGTKGVPGTGNKPGARSQAASWTDTLGNFWLFGGRVYGASVTEALRNDLWKYEPHTNKWTWVSGDSTFNGPAVTGTVGVPSANNTPSARSLTNYWIDKDGMFWVFGGVAQPSAASRRNDLWKFNPYTHEWTLVRGNPATADAAGVYGTMGTGNTANTPGGRAAAACWADASGNLWLFGGQGQASTSAQVTGLSDWWKYTIANNEWTWMGGPNVSSPAANYGTQGVMSATNIPGGRYLPVSWKDTAGNFWMMGGVGFVTTSSGMLNDLWKFNPTLNQWVWMSGTNVINDAGLYISQGVSSANRRPKSRRTTTTWLDISGNLWLFGGTTAIFFTQAVDDIWKYDIGTNEWTWVKGDSTAGAMPVYNVLGVADPANRVGARGTEVSWRSKKSNNLWIFGGHIPAYATRNDLWKIEACAPITNLSAINGDDSICAGATFTYTVPGIANPLDYLWEVPAGWSSNINGNSITVVPNGNSGALSVKAVNYCSDTSNVQVKNIVVSTITPPVITPSNIGGQLTLSVNNIYSSYQWYLGGTAIPGATAYSCIPVSNGIYTVEVIGTGGCSAVSAAENVGTLSVEELQQKAGISIFPNPASDKLTILSKMPVTARILDVQGRTTGTYTIRAGEYNLNLSALPSGMYYIEFKTQENNTFATKLIKK